MNHLLTGIGNGETAYNRIINKELCDMIDTDDTNEDFINIQEKVKELIDKKEGIASPEELKKKLFDIIYKNKSKLPSSEYYYRTLKMNIYSKHKRLDLSSQRGEKELQKNIDTCLEQCLNTSRSTDSLVKQIIIFEIMRQGYEFKRRNEESLHVFKEDTAGKIVHTLDIESEKNSFEEENTSNEKQLEIEFPNK